MVSEQKIKKLNEAFENSKKRELLSIFTNPDSNEYKAVEIILLRGRIYNYEFRDFRPNCLSHTRTINRAKDKIELCSDYTIKTNRVGKTKTYYWTIIKKGGAR